MEKIMVIGLSGSGKSTLAEQLGKKYGLPVYHLDRYYWMPGWVKIDLNVFQEVHAALIQQEAWIIEGNSMVSFDSRLDAADTIIFLDFYRIPCLWRLLKRRFFCSSCPGKGRPCGCSEKITGTLLFYVLWYYQHAYRPIILKKLIRAKIDGKKVYIITSSHQLSRLFC